jgi:hypothetical protein
MATPSNNTATVKVATSRTRKTKEAAKATVYAKVFSEVADIDTKDAKIERGLRQATHAITAQVHLLKGEIMQLETVLDKAIETKKVKLINDGNDITDTATYVANLISAENAVTKAEEAIETLNKKIEYLENLLKEINTEESI